MAGERLGVQRARYQSPVNYSFSPFRYRHIPRLLAEKCQRVRRLAKANQSGKIVEIFGKSGVFCGPFGSTHNLEVVGSNPAPATVRIPSNARKTLPASGWQCGLMLGDLIR